MVRFNKSFLRQVALFLYQYFLVNPIT